MFPSILKIGNLNISPASVLAPMSGITNSAFRRLIKLENENALGLLTTEFVSVEGLSRNVERIVQSAAFREEEKPISVQIYGHDIGRMLRASEIVQSYGADIVDINACCPAPKVVKKGGGCSLMTQPEHLKNLLVELRKKVICPLTIKIRAGWDEKNKNAVEIASLAQDCGVDAICIHARTRRMMYSGHVDWNLVQAVVTSVSIPVIGSGDITDELSLKAALDTGVSAVMIGRGAMSNPWIFLQLFCASKCFKKGEWTARLRVLDRFIDMQLKELPEKAVIGRSKQFASCVLRNKEGVSELRQRLCRSPNLNEFRKIYREYVSSS